MPFSAKAVVVAVVATEVAATAAVVAVAAVAAVADLSPLQNAWPAGKSQLDVQLTHARSTMPGFVKFIDSGAYKYDHRTHPVDHQA
jgi:hypothetical protein